MLAVIPVLKQDIMMEHPETRQEILDLWAAGRTDELEKRLKYGFLLCLIAVHKLCALGLA